MEDENFAQRLFACWFDLAAWFSSLFGTQRLQRIKQSSDMALRTRYDGCQLARKPKLAHDFFQRPPQGAAEAQIWEAGYGIARLVIMPLTRHSRASLIALPRRSGDHCSPKVAETKKKTLASVLGSPTVVVILEDLSATLKHEERVPSFDVKMEPADEEILDGPVENVQDIASEVVPKETEEA